MPLTPSTRWCPTPEQLMILEEMYRSGVRTPNASRIQQITAHLSLYGKIEGKNVFYWFQNHKARDRQKLRRRLGRNQQPFHQPDGGVSEGASSATAFHQQKPPNYAIGEEATNFQGLNLVEKLEAAGVGQEEPTPATITMDIHGGQQWPLPEMMDDFGGDGCTIDNSGVALKTLDLFPVKSTSIKDECSSSKFSPCTTSNN